MSSLRNLINLQIEITTACNFKCYYCSSPKVPNRYMSLEQFKEIVDLYDNTQSLIVLCGMGEPVLHPKLFEMADYCILKGHEPRIITNLGYTLTDSLIKKFDIFKKIWISLDTLDPIKSIEIGRTQPQRTIENIEKLIRVRGPNFIHILSVYEEYHNLDLIDWCREKNLVLTCQPLQTKPDYIKYYGDKKIPVVERRGRCSIFDSGINPYYNIDGIKLPCCFIQDTSVFVSEENMRETFDRGEIPDTCIGCRYLK